MNHARGDRGVGEAVDKDEASQGWRRLVSRKACRRLRNLAARNVIEFGARRVMLQSVHVDLVLDAHDSVARLSWVASFKIVAAPG